MTVPVLALFLAVLAGLMMIMLYSAFARRRTITDADGERRLAPSEIEEFLGPLLRLAGRRQRGRAKLMRELKLAKLDHIGYEMWVLLPWLLGTCVFGVIFGAFAAMGLTLDLAALLGGFMGLVAFFYPRLKLKAIIDARQAAIREDSIRFVSQFTRTFSTFGRIEKTLQVMNAVAERDRERRRRVDDLPDELRRRYRRTNQRGPYESELWDGLNTMVARIPQGLLRKDATLANPDAYIEFAQWCRDDDITAFVETLREAEIRGTTPKQHELDSLVAVSRDNRIEGVRREMGKAQTQAVMLLVSFNLPVLLGVCLMPVGVALMTLGG
jgi:hypothetical protein